MAEPASQQHGLDDEEEEEIDYDHPPFPLTAIDRELLAMRDEEFSPITWEDLKRIIESNTLAALKRKPSDLRRYLSWSHGIKRRHGSLTAFVLAERLHWTPLPPSSPADPPRFTHACPVPFADPADRRVLPNDWPYGLADGITHLVAWSRVPIAVAVGGDGDGDGERTVGGDLTAASRAAIERFVAHKFAAVVGAGNVLWFKNWVGLQSVRGVDHVHVLVRGAGDGVVEGWTGEGGSEA